MQCEVEFSPDSLAHLQAIEAYLAERFYQTSAERYVGRIIEACLRLKIFPHIGTRREDHAPGMRVIGFEHRVAIYFIVGINTVRIIGILHGGRAFSTNA